MVLTKRPAEREHEANLPDEALVVEGNAPAQVSVFARVG